MNMHIKNVLRRLWGPTGSLIFHVAIIILLINFITFTKRDDAPDVTVMIMEPDAVELEELEPLEEPPDIVDTMTPPDVNQDMDMAEIVEETLSVEEPLISTAESPLIMPAFDELQSGDFEQLLDAGKMTTRFMGDEAKGKRFAFVIDYSRSMSKNQLAVMKYELYKAIKGVGEEGLVTVLLFSGPVWRLDQDALATEKKWTKRKGGGYKLKRGAKGPDPQWLSPTGDNLEALERLIYKTPTTYGTDWFNPLKLVLEMSPRPDMVVFMTDGSVSEKISNKTIEYVERLPRRMVRINTIALGVDRDKAEPLRIISDMTGGKFRLYDKEELAEVAQKLPRAPTTFSSKRLHYLNDREISQKLEAQQTESEPDDVVITIL